MSSAKCVVVYQQGAAICGNNLNAYRWFNRVYVESRMPWEKRQLP